MGCEGVEVEGRKMRRGLVQVTKKIAPKESLSVLLAIQSG
jgi:hypothetical protein